MCIFCNISEQYREYFDCKLHKLILKTNKMALVVKQDVHCWKEIRVILAAFCFEKMEWSQTWSFFLLLQSVHGMQKRHNL